MTDRMNDGVVTFTVNMIPTDHWIVCAGMRILSHRLSCQREAMELARSAIIAGEKGVTLQHVGGTA